MPYRVAYNQAVITHWLEGQKAAQPEKPHNPYHGLRPPLRVASVARDKAKLEWDKYCKEKGWPTDS